MSSVKSDVETAETVPSGYWSGGNRRAKQLAEAVPSIRAKGPVTARSRVSAAKSKKARAVPMGPTPERLAKTDVVRTAGGFHRSISPVERLRDQCKLDHDSRTNEGMFQAAEKLKRHFASCMIGVKAQDLNKVIGAGASDDLGQEESWVHHFDQFVKACKLMGWSETNPHRGAGRIVVAVVCYESTVFEAATEHLGLRDTNAIKAAGMDRLREGLFSLACYWRLV